MLECVLAPFRLQADITFSAIVSFFLVKNASRNGKVALRISPDYEYAIYTYIYTVYVLRHLAI